MAPTQPDEWTTVRRRSHRPGSTGPAGTPRATRRAFLLSSGLGSALISLTGCGGGIIRYARALLDDEPDADEGRRPEPPEGGGPAIARAQASLDQVVAEARAETIARVAEVWGDEAALPAPKVWVWYDKPGGTRCFINYERGEVLAETVIAPGEDPGAAIARLRDMVHKAANDAPADMATRDIVLRAATGLAADRGIAVPAPPPPPNKKPVLAGVVAADVAERVTAERVTASTVVGGDGKERTKLSYRVPFSEGFYIKFAERYAEIVLREARAREVAPSLILAVIQTESAFNPRATSPIPAYGLMQIVPRSAGLDAHAFLRGEPRVLGPEYLYDPANNVELGAAYLRLLDSRYLRAVEHPQSRLYCAIAAYNTGAGNVARAFAGTTSVGAAARVINGMPPERVFVHLREQLPYEETRRYLAKVTDARNNYRAWDEAASRRFA